MATSPGAGFPFLGCAFLGGEVPSAALDGYCGKSGTGDQLDRAVQSLGDSEPVLLDGGARVGRLLPNFSLQGHRSAVGRNLDGGLTSRIVAWVGKRGRRSKFTLDVVVECRAEMASGVRLVGTDLFLLIHGG